MLRTHPGGGQYDCLTITSPTGQGGIIQLNRSGTIQVHERFDQGRVDGWEPTEWDEYLRADPRNFIDRLERAGGLTRPAHVPSSVPMTLTCRVLAALAATAVKTVHRIEIQSGYIDGSGYGGGPNAMLDSFAGIPDDLRRTRHGDLFDEPGYRFWIVMRNDAPLLAFEQDTATAWTRHHKDGIDLMASYRRSRRNLLVVTLDILRLADNADSHS